MNREPPPDFRTLDYLRTGTLRQRQAFAALTELGILETLAPFDPRLVGTIPLGVDIPTSDLDIICQVAEPDAFATLLRQVYGAMPGFELARKRRYGHPIVLCEFTHRDFPIQVYGSPQPVERQRAWVHMLAEAHLLAGAGPEARDAIRALKLAGVKTEPAFARVFGLGSDEDAFDILYELGLAVMAGGGGLLRKYGRNTNPKEPDFFSVKL